MVWECCSKHGFYLTQATIPITNSTAKNKPKTWRLRPKIAYVRRHNSTKTLEVSKRYSVWHYILTPYPELYGDRKILMVGLEVTASGNWHEWGFCKIKGKGDQHLPGQMIAWVSQNLLITLNTHHVFIFCSRIPEKFNDNRKVTEYG